MVHAPPTRSRRSTTSTRRPARARYAAAVSPLCPAPTTTTSQRGPARPALFLGSFEVRVVAAGVVGDVDHACDLGHGIADRNLDALAQRDGGHPTALASTREPEVRDVVFNGDELGPTAVG